MLPIPLGRHSNPVLCVEDDAATRMVLQKLLKTRFDQVLVARDGQEGLELFLRHRPSLVITDVKMPTLDGISMAREIKVWAPGTRIIVITSYGSSDLLLSAIEIGVNDYILKPVSPERVFGAIDKCLQVSMLEHQLRDAKAQTENLLESIRDIFFALDRDGRFTYVNRKAEAYFNLPRERILGTPLADLLAEDAGAYLEALEAQEPRAFEGPSPDGGAWHEARVFPFFGGISACLRDITEERRAREEIRALAQYDRLTGLPNRTLLQDRMRQSIARCLRGDQQAALLLVALDRFKHINDSMGHTGGDQVLQEFARRLEACISECDTVARVGGDEFIILLDGIEHPEQVRWFTERIRDALAQDIQLEGVQLRLSASIGISLIPGDGTRVEDLLRTVDAAMYYGKHRGGGACHFYRPEMNARTQGLLLLESALRRSLENHDFMVEFQPQYGLRSRKLVGFEALVRWRHPERGLMLPQEFIPLAEQTGMILPLGEWVLETACRQGRAWMERCARPLRMAVNVSGRQFWQGDLVGTVSRVLARTGYPPAQLELELTESMVMHDLDQAIGTMVSLDAMGVRLAIDDFGTGHSSLSALKRLPIHVLKIDKSFIDDLTRNPSDQAISRAIIGLAQALKLGVVAEGIEHADQLACLIDLGCESGQGFFFSRPAPAPEASELFLHLSA